MTTLWRAVAPVCLGLLAVGCGSTVPTATTSSPEGFTSSLGPRPQSAQQPQTSTPEAAGPDPQSNAIADPGLVTSPGPGSSLAPQQNQTLPTPPAPVRRSGSVRVGWVVLKSNSAAASSLGFSSVATPDQTQYAQAMIDWINTHGGLGGRQIIPVFDHMDPSGNQTLDQYGAQACAAFTQDDHVEAAVDPTIGGGSSQLVTCLDRKHVVHVDTTGSLDADTAQISRHRLFMPIASVADDTLASLNASVLGAQAFYAKGSIPGLITYDEPVFHHAVEKVLKPQLKARGVTLQDDNITYLPPYSSVNDTAPISSAVSNAVLKYQAHGVDRVEFLANFSLASIVFMTDAQNQRYFPHYGLSSNDSPQTLVGLVPESQLLNATGYGWRPSYDVAADQQVQPGRANCLAIFTSRKLTFAPGSAPEAAALRHCEGALFLKAGMDASAGQTALPLSEALETKVGAYRAATVLGTSVTRTHHDGVNVTRPLAYNKSCTCFRYTGPATTFR